MRIMAAAALLLLVVVSLAAAAATSNTSESWERKRSEQEMRRIFTELKAKHGTTNSSLAEEEDEERAYAMFKQRLRDIDRGWHDDGYSVFSWERGRSEEETRRIFAEWKVLNNKTYSSIAHEEHRYTIFKEALRDLDQHKTGYAIGVHGNNGGGIDQYTDLTQEEYQAVCCGFWLETPSPGELQRVGEIQELLRLVYAPSSM